MHNLHGMWIFLKIPNGNGLDQPCSECGWLLFCVWDWLVKEWVWLACFTLRRCLSKIPFNVHLRSWFGSGTALSPASHLEVIRSICGYSKMEYLAAQQVKETLRNEDLSITEDTQTWTGILLAQDPFIWSNGFMALVTLLECGSADWTAGRRNCTAQASSYLVFKFLCSLFVNRNPGRGGEGFLYLCILPNVMRRLNCLLQALSRIPSKTGTLLYAEEMANSRLHPRRQIRFRSQMRRCKCTMCNGLGSIPFRKGEKLISL